VILHHIISVQVSHYVQCLVEEYILSEREHRHVPNGRLEQSTLRTPRQQADAIN
jgi:hypothetical protein